MSEKGFHPEAEQRAWSTMRKALETLDAIAANETSLDLAAGKPPDLSFFHTIHREAYGSPDLRLRPGLTNFKAVHEGELLSDQTSAKLHAPANGCLLFPKYPPRRPNGDPIGPIPKEIYRAISPLDSHPRHLWGDDYSA